MNKSGKVIAGIGYGAELLLIKRVCYVAVICSQQGLIRRLDDYGRGGRTDWKLDLFERYGQCSGDTFEAGGRYRNGIIARRQELEMVNAILVGLRSRGAPFRNIPKNDHRLHHCRARRIGHGAGGLSLRAKLH